MEILKLCVVLLSFLATALACDLKQTDEEIKGKKAVADYVASKLPTIGQTYRLRYHVAPPVGWMNDPNGFSYFKDQFHLFYQYNPFDIIPNNNIHWGHAVSTDLVTWTQKPVALLPGPELCFSGSAIEKDGTLVLMYTAHTILSTNPDTYTETQYLAFSNDGVVFNKYKNNPVIASSPNKTVDFRDPKVWKHGDYWYVVLGSHTEETSKRGQVLLYRSSDLGVWEYFGILAESSGNLGYMWECPDFFELDGYHILLMSPQGITDKTTDRYQNTFQTGYIIGNFSYETGQFVEVVSFQEIDYGHDFYATQTMERNNKRYLIAWMADWGADFTEKSEGWAGAMTIVRELTLRNGRILMKPVDSITTLRDKSIINNTLGAGIAIDAFDETGELIVSNFDLSKDFSLTIKGKTDTSLLTLSWDSTNNKVVLNRNNVIRQGTWTPVGSRSWRIFLDASSIEVFCGEGEVVFSSRAYPTGTWVVTNAGTQDLRVEAYTIKRSVNIP